MGYSSLTHRFQTWELRIRGSTDHIPKVAEILRKILFHLNSERIMCITHKRVGDVVICIHFITLLPCTTFIDYHALHRCFNKC